MAVYALQFHTLADSGWNELALMAMYLQGLDSGVCLYLAISDDSIWLE